MQNAGKAKEVQFRFADTTEPQHAVFLTAFGHAGGPGAAEVYIKPRLDGRVRVSGQLVLLTHEGLREIEKRLNFPTPNGANYVLVEAKVHVERLTGTVTSNPPSKQSYMGVVLDQIIRVDWYLPPS